MAKIFDALTRSLLESHPADWLTLLGLTHGEPSRVVNSDLSTVTAEADKVILVEGPEPWLVHVELQTGFDKTLPRRLLRYNALLNLRHDLPVHSVAVLLRPEADGISLDGALRQRSPDGRCSLEFRYHVVRVWELPTQALLSGGPGVLPLAPITAATVEDVPPIIEDLKQRVDPAGGTPEACEFWTATALMTGLRFPGDRIEDSVVPSYWFS
jgi:predicted transposase YdaD